MSRCGYILFFFFVIPILMPGIILYVVGFFFLHFPPVSVATSNVPPINFAGELQRNVANVITTWQKLLKSYLPDIDEEVCTFALDWNYNYFINLQPRLKASPLSIIYLVSGYGEKSDFSYTFISLHFCVKLVP